MSDSLSALLYFCFLSLVATCVPFEYVIADVYTDGVQTPSAEGSLGYTGSIQTFLHPISGAEATLFFNISGSNVLTATDYDLAVGQEWFSATPGTAFDASYVAANQPFANSNTGNLGSVQLNVGINYFAFQLKSNFPQPYSPYYYGWAEINYTSPTNFTLVSSGIDDSNTGIIVGTTQVTPEPSPLAFLEMGLLAIAGLGSYRRFTEVRIAS